MNTTLALIKPDAFQRKLVGVIISYIENSGLTIAAVGYSKGWAEELAHKFYGRQHAGRPYYDILINHMLSGPVMTLVLEGENSIKVWRDKMGPADPAKRQLGEIRYDLARDWPVWANLVHGSDSEESLTYEMGVLCDFWPNIA